LKKINARNQLEGLCYQFRNQLKDEKVKSSMSEDKRKEAEEKIEQTIKWLESNKDVSDVSEYERRVKELE
jgi:heat shock 70kDa protein 1/2/6/8